MPEKNIIAPAIRWLYFSTGLRLILFNPSLNASTTDIIVPMVTTENSIETIKAPAILLSAAGYITKGINGSHGPKTKIRKRIQGVVLTTSSSCI